MKFKIKKIQPDGRKEQCRMCQAKEKKEYMRSVRMSKTVQKYVEQQPGSGFNQQFENMVLYCMKKEPELKKRILEKEKRLGELNEKIQKSQSVLQDIDNMRYQVEMVIKKANAMTENI